MKRLIIKKKNKFLCLPTLEKKNSCGGREIQVSALQTE